MKNIKIYLFVITSLLLFSCENYLDVNKDPNNLQSDQIGPDKLLPTAQLGAFRNQNTGMNQLGNVFMNSWSPNVQSYTGGFSRETGLIIDDSFYKGIFNTTFLEVTNFQAIIEKPNADHKYDNYIAVAKILKAYYMQYAVDLYGDIPYTEAFKRTGNPSPKYNDDQFIYRKLLTELDDARTIIDLANPNALDISAFDIMLKGDMITWKQVANTVELKMLLRMSNNTGAVAAYRDLRLSNLQQNFITTDLTINPGFTTNNDDQLNPFYFFAVADAGGSTVQNYGFIAPSAHVYKAFSLYNVYPTGNPNTEVIAGSGVNYPNVSDPRRGRLFRNGGGQTAFRGVTQGSTSVDMFPSTDVQTPKVPGRIGLGVYNPYNQDASIVNTTTLLATGGKVNSFVITKAEVEFLQAEAALRLYSGFSGTQGHFDAGITASMEYLNATPGSYITTINAIPYFGLTASASFDQKLHAIMYQKWIALMSNNGVESFIDYNRTGFPLTPMAIGASQPRKPRRLIYPSEEFIANAVNVPKITVANIFAATDASHPFWQLGNPTLGN